MKTSEQSKPKKNVYHISKMNRNPRLYKYYWRVVTKYELPVDLQVVKFLSFPEGPSDIPMSSCLSVESKEQDRKIRSFIVENFERMCLFDALKRMKKLEASDQPYVSIDDELPRFGSPFNPNHEKWKNREFAPAFDEDSDPVVDGHK